MEKKKVVLRKKPTVVEEAPKRDIDKVVQELVDIRDKKKMLSNREKELKEDMMAFLDTNGVKDSKGSYNAVVGDKVITKQARKSIKLNEEKARILLEGRGLWRQATITVDVIDEGLIEQLVLSGELELHEVESFHDVKTTYASVIKDYEPVEEMPTIG